MTHPKIGIGVIARDYEMKVIATLRMNKNLFPNPLLAKSYEALQATIFGLELGLRKVIIEYDSLQIIRAFKNEEKCMDQCRDVCDGSQG